ncbi:hypothetical protein B0H34DRAFT_805211 [Crassisporium funariophilum]|nr:hypothetical protein B0H34DRAFT_805211 [Crassisporium funariophilum]
MRLFEQGLHDTFLDQLGRHFALAEVVGYARAVRRKRIGRRTHAKAGTGQLVGREGRESSASEREYALIELERRLAENCDLQGAELPRKRVLGAERVGRGVDELKSYTNGKLRALNATFGRRTEAKAGTGATSGNGGTRVELDQCEPCLAENWDDREFKVKRVACGVDELNNANSGDDKDHTIPTPPLHLPLTIYLPSRVYDPTPTKSTPRPPMVSEMKRARCEASSAREGAAALKVVADDHNTYPVTVKLNHPSLPLDSLAEHKLSTTHVRSRNREPRRIDATTAYASTKSEVVEEVWEAVSAREEDSLVLVCARQWQSERDGGTSRGLRNNISTSLPPPFRDTKTPTTKPASRRSSLLLRPSNGVGGGSRETVRWLRGRSRLELDRRFMVGEAGRVGCGRHGWSRTTQKHKLCTTRVYDPTYKNTRSRHHDAHATSETKRRSRLTYNLTIHRNPITESRTSPDEPDVFEVGCEALSAREEDCFSHRIGRRRQWSATGERFREFGASARYDGVERLLTVGMVRSLSAASHVDLTTEKLTTTVPQSPRRTLPSSRRRAVSRRRYGVRPNDPFVASAFVCGPEIQEYGASARLGRHSKAIYRDGSVVVSGIACVACKHISPYHYIRSRISVSAIRSHNREAHQISAAIAPTNPDIFEEEGHEAWSARGCAAALVPPALSSALVCDPRVHIGKIRTT